MRGRRKLIAQLVLLVVVFFSGYTIYEVYYTDSVKVANWNLQIFGLTKASDAELMQIYADKVKSYDIVFVQEIRDASETAFGSLCDMLENYTCVESSRAGRTNSKEQYGIIYKNGIDLISFKDYNPDSQDRWERPPIEAVFDINGYELKVYNIHTSPDEVDAELKALEDIIENNGNVIVLGDLNADCSYYNNAQNLELESLVWVINDDEDTTVSQTNCAYDRILMNGDAYKNYEGSGVDKNGITGKVSDHYIVWVEVGV